jgi:hypothetical protein
MTVPPGTDLHSFAHKLLRKHRDAASLEALRQADTLILEGDIGGYMVWRRIARTIEHIQRMERKSDMAA